MKGGCLCKALRFSAHPTEAAVVACHCGQWGHFWAAVVVSDLQIEDDSSLRWFRSSDEAERGFCANCGTSLFWRADGRDEVAVSAGALDEPTGLQLTGHIYVADKGDYYMIADGLPEFATVDEGS